MKGKRLRIALLVVLLIVFSGGGVFWWWKSKAIKSNENVLVLYGNVDIREVNLAFTGSERIQEMFAEEGDSVKEGQLLARLETNRFQHAVDMAEAQVEAQAQIVARLEAGTRPEEIRKARAEVEAAKAEAQNASLIYRRRRPLVNKEALSQEQADNAGAAAKAARSRLKAAEEMLALALAGPRKEDIDSAKAKLRALKAELALVRQNLADAFLYAPQNGIIRDRILEPGDMASPQRPVYTLALTDPVWVRVYVPEPDLGKIWIGMAARIQTDSYPGKSYPGWVGFISPTAEFTPKSVETPELRTRLVYQARVYACNPLNELRLGMPATVVIPLDQPKVDVTSHARRCKKSDGGQN